MRLAIASRISVNRFPLKSQVVHSKLGEIENWRLVSDQTAFQDCHLKSEANSTVEGAAASIVLLQPHGRSSKKRADGICWLFPQRLVVSVCDGAAFVTGQHL